MSATATRDRAYEQRIQALARAQGVRTFRSELKRDVKSGRVAVEDVLLSPPAAVGTMRVSDLLLSLPMWGRVKVGKTLRRAGVSPAKRIGSLSERQRRELVSRLEAR